MSACSAVPSGGDVSTDCGASDEGDDPELPLRGTKVFDHKKSNCLAGHACRGRSMRMQRCLGAESRASVGPLGRPTSEAKATALEKDAQKSHCIKATRKTMKHRVGMRMRGTMRMMARMITRDPSGVIYCEWVQVGMISGPILNGTE